YAVEHRMVGRDIGVEDPEGLNHLAAGIGEHRELDLIGVAEGLQRVARVVGDRCGVDAGGLQFSQREVQLDELIAAIGSPTGAAAEYQQQAAGSSEIGKGTSPAILIR